MKSITSPISPGQRFRQLDGWTQEQVVTVARLDEDAMGLPRVYFRTPGGREICAYASQIDAAIAVGQLTPLDDHQLVTVFAREPEKMLAS